jgi:hypothetical protein
MEIRFKKVNLQNEELGLQIGKHTVSIKRFFDVVLIAVLLVFAYNMGVHDAEEMVKLTAFLSEKGVCYSQDYCFKCDVMARGNKIVWVCDNNFNTSLSNYIGVK